MKRKLFSLIALTLCVLMLLASCSNDPIKLTYNMKTGQYVDDDNRVAYFRAPLHYEAVGLKTDSPYAQLNTKRAELLYEIDYADPKEMIANEYFEIFYAQKTHLPTLFEMCADKVYVDQIITGAVLEPTVAIITNGVDIAHLVGQYNLGKAASFVEDEMLDGNTLAASYTLRFASSAYPAFRYCLEYLEYEDEILIYEVIESKEGFVPTYTGALSVSFDESYVDKGELYAVYHFGYKVIFDQVTGDCYPVGDTVSKYLTQN